MKNEIWDQFMRNEHELVLSTVAKHLSDTGAFDAVHVAGLSLIETNRLSDGIDWLCASLSLTNPIAEWFINAARVTMKKSMYPHAQMFLENGVRQHPLDVKMHYMLGLAYVFQNKRIEGKREFLTALDIDQAFYWARVSLAYTLQLEGKFEEAMGVYDEITNATPEDQEDINNNYSWSLMEMGRRVEALAWLKEKCQPSPKVLFNTSVMELGLGYWPDAWEHYKYRRGSYVEHDGGWKSVKQPMADIVHDIENKTVLFFSEQGLGDTIQFMRYAKLIEPIAKSLIIKVPDSLVRLTKALKLDKPVSVVSTFPEEALYDVALPMMDAPALFRTTVETIPAVVPYLDTHLYAVDNSIPWTGKLHVGLCWAGAARPNDLRAFAINERRSVPFEIMSKLLSLWPVYDFISLQMPEHSVEDDRIGQPLESHFDFIDTARIVEQLDLVITVDSAIAHLAGALGKRVWMLNRFDGCWRWFWKGQTFSAWYPTMRIFNQTQPGNWKPVIDEIYTELETYFDKITG